MVCFLHDQSTTSAIIPRSPEVAHRQILLNQRLRKYESRDVDRIASEIAKARPMRCTVAEVGLECSRAIVLTL